MKFPWTKQTSREVPITGRAIRSSNIQPSHAKIIREVNGRMFRMFEAAISNNLNADFPVTISSGNAEVFTSILATRARARTLERDNAYAWAMIRSMMANVGGHDPFRLEMKVGKKTPEGEFVEEKDTNELIQEWWKDAGKPANCTTRRDTSRQELYLQGIAAMVRDGGILWRHWRGFEKNPYRYAVQPLEIDRLDHYYNGKNEKTGNDIIMSKEVDRWGGVVSYWLLTKHPGDIFFQSNWGKQYREEVPAEDIIALFDLRTRAEQQVGITRFASIIQHLHRIGQFDTAHVTAAIWSACKPLFLLKKLPTAGEYVPDFIRTAMEREAEGEAGGGPEGQKEDTARPGETTELPYGVEPWQADPKFPIEAATGFKKDNLRAACAGSATAYHMIGNDLEGVNFSSGRLGENQFHDECKIAQEHFILNAVEPHFNVALEYALLSGELKLPYSRLKEFQKAAHFHGRRWPYINPLQDAQADVIRIEAGLDSRDRVIQESDRGGDVEKVNAEIASGRKSDQAHGLDFSVVTKPTISKGEPGPGPDDDKPAPKPETNGKSNRKIAF